MATLNKKAYLLCLNLFINSLLLIWASCRYMIDMLSSAALLRDSTHSCTMFCYYAVAV